MTIGRLNKELEDLLQKFIEKEGHIDTGALYKSIKFNCKDEGDRGLTMELSSKYYIDFLQKGKFLDKFWRLNSVVDLINEYYVENIDVGF